MQTNQEPSNSLVETGSFLIHGNTLKNTHCTYKISTRKKASDKPKRYLMKVVNGKWTYVSSLYQNTFRTKDSNTYTLERDGILYELKLIDETQAEIRKVALNKAA